MRWVFYILDAPSWSWGYDFKSRRDYKRNVVIFSFIYFCFFCSLLCCDENLWWITFSLCLLYMNEALFQKYIFLNFFSLLHIIYGLPKNMYQEGACHMCELLFFLAMLQSSRQRKFK